MNFIVHFLSILIATSMLFSLETSEDIRAKLAKYDIEKAEKINSTNNQISEWIEKQRLNSLKPIPTSQFIIKENSDTRECTDNWIGDGYCDSSNNTEECQWDGGDCCGSTCTVSTYDCQGGSTGSSWAACLSECLDPNANDECCVDNSCPFTCEGNGLVTCWDGSCAETEADCSEVTCADTDCGLYIGAGYFCDELEQNFGYDCSICEEEGACPLTCEEEGLITCADGSCAAAEEDCPDLGCADIGGIESWIGDGYCDSSNNNEACSWDGGDCCGSTCLASSYDCVGSGEGSYGACYNECLDPNANDDCCIDNSCPFTCEGNGLITCWDGSCAEVETDCPEITCADTECSYYLTTYTCPQIEQLYGYDCSVCEDEGVCPLTCEDEGLITCETGECAVSEQDCNSCTNPVQAVEGSNYSGGYDEFYTFTVEESGFLTLSTAGAGIDTKLMLYASCNDVDLNYPYGQYLAYNDDWGSSQYGVCPDCTYSLESYINVAVPEGDYIILSEDGYNSAHNPFEWTLAFEVGVEGCTNETADNYNPEANIDDGSCEFADGVFFISCDGGSWQTEVAWELINEDTEDIVLTGGAPYESTVALDPGRYYLNAMDSYGDGWNGNIWEIIDAESNLILTFTLDGVNDDGSSGISETFVVEGGGCALLGDANGDGSLNVVDIVAIVNAVLNGINLEEVIFCGDFNEDGILNVVDIVGIVNAILES